MNQSSVIECVVMLEAHHRLYIAENLSHYVGLYNKLLKFFIKNMIIGCVSISRNNFESEDNCLTLLI